MLKHLFEVTRQKMNEISIKIPPKTNKALNNETRPINNEDQIEISKPKQLQRQPVASNSVPSLIRRRGVAVVVVELRQVLMNETFLFHSLAFLPRLTN